MHGAVLTDNDFQQQVKEKEQQKEKKKGREVVPETDSAPDSPTEVQPDTHQESDSDADFSDIQNNSSGNLSDTDDTIIGTQENS